MKSDKSGGASSSDELSSDRDHNESYQKGLNYLRESQFDKAKEEFDKIIRENPENAQAHFGLGCVFSFQGLTEKAFEEWNRAIEIDPDCGEAHYALAGAYYNAENREKGYEHVNKAVESGVDLNNVKDIFSIFTEGIDIASRERKGEPYSIFDSEGNNVKRKGLTLFELVLKGFPNSNEMKIALGIVSVGLAIRLFSLLFITPTDFRWESYHYWQIAYYTLHVGTKHLRMWDLGGMEYFWGPLPIWIQSTLLWILRTKSITPFRVFNTMIGSVTIFLSYKIGLRYGNTTSAKVSAVIAAVNPILVFNSIVGMEETLGVFFILLSLLVMNDNWVYGGIFLGLASLCRIEFWPLSLGLIFSIYLFERDRYNSQWFSVLIGWMIPLVPYMIHLQFATGNAIYPFYWNFLGNIAGVWNPWYVDPLIRGVFSVILVASVVSYLVLFKYRKRIGEYYIILITAFGFMGYHGLVYAVSGTAPLFERFFVLDAALVSCLVGIISIRMPSKRIASIVIGMILLVSYALSVQYYVKEQYPIRDRNEFTDILIEEYSGGTILSDMPMITYRLIQKGGISYINILGTIYANYQSPDTALEWLRKENATYLITDTAHSHSYKMVTFLNEHDLKDDIFTLNSSWKGISIYNIDQEAIESYLFQ